MRKIVFFGQLLFLSVLLTNCRQPVPMPEPIKLHGENQHYFSYSGKPTLLITSGEHYGAVLNPHFDYVTYLKTLQTNGLNMTRTFVGGYFEPPGAFNIADNTLAPNAADFLCPWIRTADNTKFDLYKWDDKFFSRLKNFMYEAQKHGVIVELTLACPFYEEMQWELSPYNSKNNINGMGAIARTDVYTLDKNGELLGIQESMVRKIVSELQNFPNLIYEICNEPYFGGVTLEWQEHISKIIAETEKDYPYKHLISQNIANGSQFIENPNPLVAVFNFHYATPPVTVAQNYHLNKVVGDNETGFKGQKDSTYRKEAWEFILAGGALFNNLDYSFTVKHPDGTFQYPENQPGGGTPALRKQLGMLKNFVESFVFVSMKPDTGTCTGGIPIGLKSYMLSEAGKQYAFYLMGGKQVSPEFEVPAGNYHAEWLDPLNCKTLDSLNIEHKGGTLKLVSPAYFEDIALKLILK